MTSGALARPQLQHLAFHGQLTAYFRSLAEEKYIADFPFSREERDRLDSSELANEYLASQGLSDQAALQRWCQNLLIESSSALKAYIRHQESKKLIIGKLLEANGESAFLKYKDRLDRVLYSIIRVSTEARAHHIYYSIENGEITFADAATQFSQGIESRSAGIVGPVDLATPHPEIASRLRSGLPGQLFEPFMADEWYVVLSLLYRFEATFEDVTKKTLGSLLFAAKVSDYIPIISNALLNEQTPPVAS